MIARQICRAIIGYAKQGRDCEVELRQIAKEKALMKELGIGDEEKPDDAETTKDSDNEGEEDGNQE